MSDSFNLTDKAASLEKPWTPKVVAELNGQFVKVGMADGEYVWHTHEDEDEMFLVTEGHLEIHLRDRVIELGVGDSFVIPRGVEHKPVSRGISRFVLFEPATTRNTGAVDHDYTIEPEDLERI